MRLVVLLAALAAVAGCSAPSGGVDVSKLKVTSTEVLPLKGPNLLSPDGTKALVGQNQLCVLAVNGKHKVCMPSDANVVPDIQHAVWSPDGKYIAFTDNFLQGFLEPDIWVMGAASGKVTDLTDDGISKIKYPDKMPSDAKLDLYPSWSADGKTIRFARQVGNSASIELASVPATGGNVSKLGTISGRLINLFGLTFSPDGTMVAYSYTNDFKKGTVHLRQFGAFGSGRTLSTPGRDNSLLSFSPDDRYLLVDSAAPYQVYSGPTTSYARVYPVDGGPGVPVAHDVQAFYPTWGPSGHALAFVTRRGRTGESALQLVAEPGGTPRTIRSGTFYGPGNYSWRINWAGGGSVSDAIILDAAGKFTRFKLG